MNDESEGNMAPDTDNGRVTLAVLATKLDQMSQTLDQIRTDHDRLVILEQCLGDHTRRLDAQDKRIEAVDTARKWEGRIEAIVAAAVAFGSWMRP
jgi:hypothetical protein